MDYDKDKVDEMTLALLWLVMEKSKYSTRAWKSFNWDSMGRLCDKGFISDPKGKARSVAVFPEGEEKAKELFKKYFTQ